MKLAKRIFQIAAVWGLLVVTSLVFSAKGFAQPMIPGINRLFVVIPAFNPEEPDAVRKTIPVAPSSPYAGLSRQQVEDFLLKAKVIRIKGIEVGITNTRRATLSDGTFQHDAHVQTVDIFKTSFQTIEGAELNFRDCYKFNIAAYELAKLLEFNMVPPTVLRKVEGEEASVSWWIDGAMMDLDRIKEKIQPPDINHWNEQINLMHIFDQLVYNTDRNQGNILICKDWRVWFIDYTRAFRERKELQNPKSLAMCDRKFLGRLRELNMVMLQRKLQDCLTNAQIETLLLRRDTIVKFFEEKITEQGEDAVLFDYERDPD
jgi:hypothetical protein